MPSVNIRKANIINPACTFLLLIVNLSNQEDMIRAKPDEPVFSEQVVFMIYSHGSERE